jgi:hypothetical protein
MEWKKKGLIFCTNNNYCWMQTHAQLPIPFKLSDDILRIYFSTRNKKGESLPTYIDTDIANPKNVLSVNDNPLLELGKAGKFDQNGIMPSSVIRKGDEILMYYIGWKVLCDLPYELSIGLAISRDNGNTFQRFSEEPIIGKSINNKIFVSCPNVLKENDKWRMWYISCSEWVKYNNRFESLYHIKHAGSSDGINWETDDKICINAKYKGEALASPWVIKEDNKYKIWYSYRGSENYRRPEGQHYNIGYAESIDGLSWQRMDERSGISISISGWDSEMIAYPSIYEYDKMKYMFYNGNGFGRSGFGYAKSKDTNTRT